jgi:hypothetical protein
MSVRVPIEGGTDSVPTMKTVVLGDPPPALASLIASRKRQGLDRHDERWQGEYHMSPAASFEHADAVGSLHLLLGPRAREVGLRNVGEFNLGVRRDFRVPDLGFHRGRPTGTWLATAAIVVEVLSPDDETLDKFEFYFDRGVEELLVVDPIERTAQWYARGAIGFEAADASDLLGATNDEVAASLDW